MYRFRKAQKTSSKGDDNPITFQLRYNIASVRSLDTITQDYHDQQNNITIFLVKHKQPHFSFHQAVNARNFKKKLHHPSFTH